MATQNDSTKNKNKKSEATLLLENSKLITLTNINLKLFIWRPGEDKIEKKSTQKQ